jgi:methionine-rich copper-binding protein CopC
MKIRSRFAPLVLALLMSAPAFAHSKPKVMVPAANSTVASPKEVSVIFSEALDPKFSTLSLTDEKGTVIPTGKTIADPENHLHLSLPLPKLAPGTYYVHWISAAVDGHKMDGDYSFTVK